MKLPLFLIAIALFFPLMIMAQDVTTLDVTTGDYNIIEKDGGHIIEMEGHGYLREPGKPMLPSKSFMVALPPGARVQSVDVRGSGATELPGKYRIMPSSPIIPIAEPQQYPYLVKEMKHEWKMNKDAIYSKDQAYPRERGKLNSSGTLRKYSYASVSVYPFSYYPQSGRLIHFDMARIRIKYDLPPSGSIEAQQVEELKRDTLADERAAGLFINYAQVRELYEPVSSKPVSPVQNYDYVIITTGSLHGAVTASNFVEWKASAGYSMKTVLITDPEISDEPRSDLAEQIRGFLRSYYGQWGIEYVLLAGDIAAIPMRLCYPDSSNHTYNPDTPYNSGGAVPTDYYYADLSYSDASSWDSDGDGFCGEYGQDSPDFLPEIYVGRIPTSDSARITYTLNKLVAFEQDTAAWKSQALHAGAIVFFENQDNSGYPFIDGARLADALETDLMNDWTVSHYSEQEGIVSSEYSWPALSLSAFTDDWCNGEYAVVNWEGHGSASGVYRMVWLWDDGDGIPETDGSDGMESAPFIAVWANLDDDYPSIVFAVSCNVGYPEPNVQGNLGIDLLTKPGSGSAVAVLSATRPAAISAEGPTSGGAESFCYEFNRNMIIGTDGLENIGNAFYDAKSYCHQSYGWDHYYEYQNLFDYNLYGDPALVREGIPEPICGDANGDSSVNILDVTCLINYLYKSGPPPDSQRAGDADGSGDINLLDITYLINYIYKNGPGPLCP